MKTAATVTVRIKNPVPQLAFDLSLDAFGEWIAQVRGYPGCIGDGLTKQGAIDAAYSLWLHVQLLRVQRGEWRPMWEKNVNV